MDKNAIKKYAVWARKELLSRVCQRAMQYGITSDEVGEADADSVNGKLLTKTEKAQRAALMKHIKEDGFEQVMEEVAYTWFNRFCALRFMEVNGYLPSHVRVFSDEENNFKPQILTEAINVHLAGLDLNKVYQLKNDNKTEELYKYLIITQCNALNSVLPLIFQQISDYTELLFPDNLLRAGSVVEQLVSQIPEEDWKDAVQIIGWLYQYYNIEPKDKVFEDLKKNIKITKDKIPAATQLFTPDWIVRYMVENSLGRMWLEGHPDSHLKESWRYFLDEAEQEESVKAKLATIREQYAKIEPKEIKCIDPCMGSGHILVYMFDVLVQIYNEYGYSSRDAAAMIVENNLFGLDIDDRAAQLAYFAVMMRGCKYDRRFLERGVQPQIYSIQESNHLSADTFEYIVGKSGALRAELQKIVDTFHDAKEYGSILEMPSIDFDLLYQRFDEIIDDISLYKQDALENFLPLVKQAEVLTQKYDVVITNPPYMGSSGMDSKLSDFVKVNYSDEKSDLFACFIEKGLSSIKPFGFSCMVTMQSWMFLSSFEKMRKKLLLTKEITNLMHMDNMVMGIAFGTAVSIFRGKKIDGYKGTYNHIKLENITNDRPKQFPVLGNRFAQINEDSFSKIPGSPIAYWISEQAANNFCGKLLKEKVDARIGMVSGDNDRFLRLWSEVEYTRIEFTARPNEDPHIKKWYPLQKGGDFRKWFGNTTYVINWENDGYELKNNNFSGNRVKSHNYNGEQQFKEGITWNSITSGKFSCRYSPWGFTFDAAGPLCEVTEKGLLYYILGMLSAKIADFYFSIINPTLNFPSGYLESLPLIQDQREGKIDSLVIENISLSKADWDSFETSWDFKKHPLI